MYNPLPSRSLRGQLLGSLLILLPDHCYVEVVWRIRHTSHQREDSAVGPEGLTHCFMRPRVHHCNTAPTASFGQAGQD